MRALSLAKEQEGPSLRIRGAMVRDFPSTAAIVLAACHQQDIILDIIWAGDSRVYALNTKGLIQLSKDDTGSQDAFEDLRNDPVQTNVLSSDGQFDLHSFNITIETPSIIIAATDGYFGYWNTPMEFEHFLLDALIHSANLDEWKARLREEIRDVSGDDATLALMAFGFNTFSQMKAFYRIRYHFLKEKYILPLYNDDVSSSEMLNNSKTDLPSTQERKAKVLWEEYRVDYEEYLPQER